MAVVVAAAAAAAAAAGAAAVTVAAAVGLALVTARVGGTPTTTMMRRSWQNLMKVMTTAMTMGPTARKSDLAGLVTEDRRWSAWLSL